MIVKTAEDLQQAIQDLSRLTIGLQNAMVLRRDLFTVEDIQDMRISRTTLDNAIKKTEAEQ